MKINRRSFLSGFGYALVSSPAIVNTSSIMPVSPIKFTQKELYDFNINQLIELQKRGIVSREYLMLRMKWQPVFD